MNVLLTVLLVLLWVILGLLALVLFVILLTVVLSAIPIKYIAIAAFNDEVNFSFRANYFFGFLRFAFDYHAGVDKIDFRILCFKIGESKKNKKIKKEKIARLTLKKPTKSSVKKKFFSEKKASSKKEGFIKKLVKTYDVLTELQEKTIIKLVFATVKKIGKVFRPKYINVSGVFGFADPCTTGLFCGAYEAVAGMFGIRDKVRLAGDFNAESTVVRLNADVRGSVSVLRIAIPVIWFITRKQMRAFIKKYTLDRKGDFDE